LNLAAGVQGDIGMRYHLLQYIFHQAGAAFHAALCGFAGKLNGMAAKKRGFFNEFNFDTQCSQLHGGGESGNTAPNDQYGFIGE
jgi:hypothetical protein